jgi:hypothetical protein
MLFQVYEQRAEFAVQFGFQGILGLLKMFEWDVAQFGNPSVNASETLLVHIKNRPELVEKSSDFGVAKAGLGRSLDCPSSIVFGFRGFVAVPGFTLQAPGKLVVQPFELSDRFSIELEVLVTWKTKTAGSDTSNSDRK